MRRVRDYLNEKQIHPLLLEIRKKYISLSRPGGTVPVTPEEAKRLSGLLGKTPEERVALADLDAALRQNNFACTLREALEAYFGQPLETRTEQQARESAAWGEVLQSLMAACEGEAGAALAWTQADAEYLKQQWRQHPGEFPGAARIAVLAINRLAEASGPLPIFANQIAGDPHALDANTLAGRYFLRGLEHLFPDALSGGESTAEARSSLLAAAGLAVDDISSAVTAAGLIGVTPWIAAARESGAAIGLPLRSVTTDLAVSGSQGVAYVVENPAVFSALLDQVADIAPADRPTIICTSGQLSLAARRLIDSLVRGGTRLFYSGDLDVAGFLILRGLMRRHGRAVEPWWMDAAAYSLALRPGEGGFSPARLDSLEPDFPEVVAAMRSGGPAYQETLIPHLAADIRAQLLAERMRTQDQ